ncbi:MULTISPECIES: ABC transporter permease [Paenibacillus]|uniref:ABC transporter permease n=1 Tax=Paenibacillus TaxID=44249 RepID=UPI000956758F|nr:MULTISPECIES: iron export ABC transporter permease subunit FetB [Paenibacillus]ASS68679.1 iron export ABC transporter permease subunit FetB [Paenibacillus sp. RUD330]SIR55641.1 putative ABC transport system permease protein [Paenibacillus sp. RU4X]SIR64116.1 putative ABC transport system permease protein [Paenibacillus sp. RU4T]
MSYTALAFTVLFIMITMFISYWQKLGLEKGIAVGTIRAAVQLLAVGYVLQAVFESRSHWLLAAIIAVMIIVAARNASAKGKGIPGIFWRMAAALLATELLMMGILLLLGIIEPTPRYIIPLSGMTIGNAMVAGGLFLTQLMRESESSRGEIETLLALGASPRQAVQGTLKRAVRYSMIPTIDGMKTVGLVQLPGMMTGMIIAGADPVEAVRYQILIVFAFTSSAAVTSMLLGLLTYRKLFSDGIGMLVRYGGRGD